MSIQPDPTIHLIEITEYISQYSTDIIAFSVYINGVLADPDSETVYVTMVDQNSVAVFTNQLTTRSGVGQYYYQLSTANTAKPGTYTITWTFNISSVAQSVPTYAEIGAANPSYDVLSTNMKDIVELTMIRFADQFDSPQGGPWLQTMFQTAFSRGRVAQLLQLALYRLNNVSQPYQSYTLLNFPAYWNGLLEKALYIETLKHLQRSYIEQATPQGLNLTRQDRSNYASQYESLLRSEQEDFKGMLDTYKIAAMQLGVPTILLSGGAYGNFARTRLPVSAAARGHFWQRNF